MSITTIRVTQQLVTSQLKMVAKSHITGAINSKSKKKRELTGVKIRKPTLPPSGFLVLLWVLNSTLQ